jgi:hypothetical protein
MLLRQAVAGFRKANPTISRIKPMRFSKEKAV